jgi:hypothetical protein
MRSQELCCSRIQNAGSRSDELLCKPHLQHVTGKASRLREQVQAALPAPDGFTTPCQSGNFFILSRLVPASLATFFNTLFDGRLKE